MCCLHVLEYTSALCDPSLEQDCFERLVLPPMEKRQRGMVLAVRLCPLIDHFVALNHRLDFRGELSETYIVFSMGKQPLVFS